MKQVLHILSFLTFCTPLSAIAQHGAGGDANDSCAPLAAQPALKQTRRSEAGARLVRSTEKTAANEKLYAFVTYLYGLPQNLQKQDSFLFTYSGNHGSAFDYSVLHYDYFNRVDYDYNTSGVSTLGYVQFDTMLRYEPSSASPSIIMTRTYDAPGNKVSVLQDFFNRRTSYYAFDISGKLSSILKTDTFSGASAQDTIGRNFYYYNGGSFDVLDVNEQWDGSKWYPSTEVRVLSNTVGAVLQENLSNFSSTGAVVRVRRITNTYNTSNQLLSATDAVSQTAGGPLVNYSKDTFAYTAGMITEHDVYHWDASLNAWMISSTESRHLNALALPDSIFRKSYNPSGTVDSAIEKIAYTSIGNPIYQRYYTGNGATLSSEIRYYYSLAPLNIAEPATARKVAIVYPNPVTNILHATGIVSGQYTITNAAGQFVAAGAIVQGSISVKIIPAGVYQLQVREPSGALSSGRFVKE